MRSLRKNGPGVTGKRSNQADPKLPPGTNYCRCSACGTYIGGLVTFDLHRVGPADDRSCLPPGEVRDKHGRPVLRLNARGYWVRRFGTQSRTIRAVA